MFDSLMEGTPRLSKAAQELKGKPKLFPKFQE